MSVFFGVFVFNYPCVPPGFFCLCLCLGSWSFSSNILHTSSFITYIAFYLLWSCTYASISQCVACFLDSFSLFLRWRGKALCSGGSGCF